MLRIEIIYNLWKTFNETLRRKYFLVTILCDLGALVEKTGWCVMVAKVQKFW